jgi:hypothetical protein
MTLTFVGLAQADDPADRLVVGAAPSVDTDQDPAGNVAVGDDSAFTIVASSVVDLDRRPGGGMD